MIDIDPERRFVNLFANLALCAALVKARNNSANKGDQCLARLRDFDTNTFGLFTFLVKFERNCEI